MEDCLENALSVLEEVKLTNCSDIYSVYNVFLSLKSVTFQLSALLNETTANGGLSQEDQCDLNQLLMNFCLLYLEYETKLVFLVTSNPSHHGD